MKRITWKLCVLSVALADAAFGQNCPRGELPAYSHNDYENIRPLHDAFALGYRGVEADIFLVGGILRLGHDRKRAAEGRSLEATYFKPLDEVLARCPFVSASHRFLFAIELKESSQAAFDSLLALLHRYPRLTATQGARGALMDIVLVGWRPAMRALAGTGAAAPAIQYQLTSRRYEAVDEDSIFVRLVSLDYGKTIGRWWVSSSRRNEWFSALRKLKKTWPGRLVRAYNVPVDNNVYRSLLDAGVDVIGTKDIHASRALLATLVHDSLHSIPTVRQPKDVWMVYPFEAVASQITAHQGHAITFSPRVRISGSQVIRTPRGQVLWRSRKVRRCFASPDVAACVALISTGTN